MDKSIIISNLKKDHFRITERYGKFILGAEYETIKKGRCISIEEYLSPDEFVSSAKAFIDEMKTVSDSFTELSLFTRTVSIFTVMYCSMQSML